MRVDFATRVRALGVLASHACFAPRFRSRSWTESWIPWQQPCSAYASRELPSADMPCFAVCQACCVCLRRQSGMFTFCLLLHLLSVVSFLVSSFGFCRWSQFWYMPSALLNVHEEGSIRVHGRTRLTRLLLFASYAPVEVSWCVAFCHMYC